MKQLHLDSAQKPKNHTLKSSVFDQDQPSALVLKQTLTTNNKSALSQHDNVFGAASSENAGAVRKYLKNQSISVMRPRQSALGESKSTQGNLNRSQLAVQASEKPSTRLVNDPGSTAQSGPFRNPLFQDRAYDKHNASAVLTRSPDRGQLLQNKALTALSRKGTIGHTEFTEETAGARRAAHIRTASTLKKMTTTLGGGSQSPGYNQVLGERLFPYLDTNKTVDDNVQRVALGLRDTHESQFLRKEPHYAKAKGSQSPQRL